MNKLMQKTVFGFALITLSGAAFSMNYGDVRSGNPAHLVRGATITAQSDGNTGVALNPGAYQHRSGAPIAKVETTRTASKKWVYEIDATLSPGASMHNSGRA
jgi:hypothetical protein